MIKALIFDFWGTLVENGVYPSPVKQAQFILGIETDFSEYIQKFEETLMLNKFENLNEGFTKVCETFGIEATEEKIERLVGMWNKNKFFAKPKPDTISTLETLKRSYKLVLVSNTDCFSVKDVLEKYDLAKYFDEIFFSYEVGKLKTDPHFFDDVLEKIGLSKDEVVMFGDSLESDIKPAEAAGIKAYLVDRRGRRDFLNKVRFLDEIPGLLGE